MEFEKDDIIVNITKVKAALFDKIVKTAASAEANDVVIEIFTAQEVLDVVESCGNGVT